MHFPMVVNWREKKECGHDAKEGADMDSVHSAVPLKSVGLNLLLCIRGSKQTFAHTHTHTQTHTHTCTNIHTHIHTHI